MPTEPVGRAVGDARPPRPRRGTASIDSTGPKISFCARSLLVVDVAEHRRRDEEARCQPAAHPLAAGEQRDQHRSAAARSMIARIRSQFAASMTGPIWTPSSNGSPTTSALGDAPPPALGHLVVDGVLRRAAGSGARSPVRCVGTKRGLDRGHGGRRSRSASANTTLADLPPSSSTTGVRLRLRPP